MVRYGGDLTYSAAYKLFHMFYLCYVPRNEMMDDNDFEYFGVAMSGNREWDEKLATAPELTNISVAEMAQLIKDGVPLTLCDPKDSVAIYKLIMEHLKDWRDALESSTLVALIPPLEGLAEFNQLAAMMVPIARCHGLVESYDRTNRMVRSQRSFSLKTRKIWQAKDACHSDLVFEEICTLAAKFGQRVNWRPTQEVMSGEHLYGK